VAEGQPLTEVAGLFFAGRTPANPDATPRNPSGSDALVGELEKIDRLLAAEKSAAAKSQLHQQRAGILEKIASGASKADREIWLRQLIDTVATAVYGGEFPEGREYMRELIQKVRQLQPELEAFAAYQAIFTDYMIRQSEPQAELAKVQEAWLQELQEFVTQYEASPESAEALRQLGFNSELENKDDAAKKWYRQAAVKFPNTEAGKKSAGAVRRLESVGRALDLKGAKLEGGQFDLQALRGGPVVIQFWATWCEPCKQDMRMLKTLQSRYRDRKLSIVGVNVDESREVAAKYLKENPAAWTQMFEEGGLENSRLSVELGIQTLPMMLLIDSTGKVVRHSILSAELDAAISELK
jgi:thiol-disulfide isomerase/thioredoxin